MMAHSHEVQFVVEQAREDRLNNRILVLPGGRLVRASDPYPGSMHDVAALDASGLLEGIDPSRWIADKGYVGRGMTALHKKPPDGELSEAAKDANKSINRIRRAGRADHRPHQVPDNPPAPTTAAPCTHSSRPSPPHPHSTSSKPPLNKLPGSADRGGPGSTRRRKGSAESAEIARLRAENRELRAENEFLKKGAPRGREA